MSTVTVSLRETEHSPPSFPARPDWREAQQEVTTEPQTTAGGGTGTQTGDRKENMLESQPPTETGRQAGGRARLGGPPLRSAPPPRESGPCSRWQERKTERRRGWEA